MLGCGGNKGISPGEDKDKDELTQHIELLKREKQTLEKTKNDNTRKLGILQDQIGFLNGPQTSVTSSSLTNSQISTGVDEGDTKEDLEKAIVKIQKNITDEQKEIAEKTKEIGEKTKEHGEKTKEIAEKTRQTGATTSPNGTTNNSMTPSRFNSMTPSRPGSMNFSGGNRGGRKLKTKTKRKRKGKGKFRKKRKTRRNKNKKTTRKNN